MLELLLTGLLWRAVAMQAPPRLEITYPYYPVPHPAAEGSNVMGTAFSSAGITAVSWETSHGDAGPAALWCDAFGSCGWETGFIPLPPGSTVVTVRGLDVAGVDLVDTITIESRGFPVTHRVDCSRATSGDGSVHHPFNALQEAVDAAYAGDTIQINGSPCDGPLWTTRGLTIQGDPESPPAVINIVGGHLATDTPDLVTFRHLRMVREQSELVGIQAWFYPPIPYTVRGDDWHLGAQTLVEDVEGATVEGAWLPRYVIRRCRDIVLHPSSGGTTLYADIEDSTAVRMNGYPSGGVVEVAIRNSEVTEFRLDNHGQFFIDIEHSEIRSGDFQLGQNFVNGLDSLRLTISDSRIESTSIDVNRYRYPCHNSCTGATSLFDISMERNLFTDSHVGLDLTNHSHSDGALQSFLLQNNVMERSSIALHLRQSDATASGLTRGLIRHNTFIGAAVGVGAAGETDQSAPPDWSVEIANNIFYGSGTAIAVASDPAGLIQASILGNDLHRNGADIEQDGTAVVDGNISTDPLFREQLTGDYRLRAGSPCIDSALDINAPPADDLGGSPRPQDGNGDGTARPDVGAWESQAPPGTRTGLGTRRSIRLMHPSGLP